MVYEKGRQGLFFNREKEASYFEFLFVLTQVTNLIIPKVEKDSGRLHLLAVYFFLLMCECLFKLRVLFVIACTYIFRVFLLSCKFIVYFPAQKH